MRIAYGVHGYGRGHAMRVLGVLPDLLRHHQILLLAGGDAVAPLERIHPVERIPTLSYAYEGDRMSTLRTVRTNARLAVDLALRGPSSRGVEKLVSRFRPDVVISDSEPLLLHAARRLGIPRIGFDHVGVIAHCRPTAPQSEAFQLRRDAAFYDALLGRPDRAVVSSFYSPPPRHPGVRIVPPVLRRSILEAKTTVGEHLLVYFNRAHLVGRRVLEALASTSLPVVIYGDREGRDGSLTFRRVDPDRFVQDLASCRALVCTGGHQLASEALHLGKPMLVIPEASAEQRLNARELVRLGVARTVEREDLDARVMNGFLGASEGLSTEACRLPRSGNTRAVAVLEAEALDLISPASPASSAAFARPAA